MRNWPMWLLVEILERIADWLDPEEDEDFQ